MELTELSRQVRLVCESSLPLTDLLAAVEEFVEGSLSDKSIPSRLEQELQSVYDDVVDQSPSHIQIFLALLFQLRLLLSPSSIISSWFDLVIRPALRLPKLSTSAVQQARELVLLALSSGDEASHKKVLDFRRRVLDLYLYDAYNEGSGDDVLEWAELNSLEREKGVFWKSNLEEILLKFGELRPLELLNEIDRHFVDPPSRLQLVIFMNIYISSPCFTWSTGAILAEHSLMDNLVLSLLLDNSTTICTISLNVLTKLLPIYAVHASSVLPGMLHRLFAIFSRMLCWRRKLVIPSEDPEHPDEEDIWDQDGDIDPTPSPVPRDDLNWQLLGSIFPGSSSPPNCRTYFSFLYYLFPSNLFKFLWQPILYFNESPFPSPYQIDWNNVFDETKLRTLSEYLFRRHIFHPRMLWQGAEDEQAGRCFWRKYDVACIASEAALLDIRNISLAFRERLRNAANKTTLDDKSPEKFDQPQVLLQSMVETAALLKSGSDIKTVQTTSHWSPPGFGEPAPEDHVPEVHLPSHAEASTPPTRVVSDLQRQVLLLRSELNFELWLARENIKHIGRLHQDRSLTQNAEVERQGLYNKLRNYRSQVGRLESELRENKEQAIATKNQYVDWNAELQKKLRELREEKKAWIAEAAKLRSDSTEAEGLFKAQGKLLSDATKEVFHLQTQRKETQHKVDRLHDYEKQIEQHMKMQTLWSEDFARFNERGLELEFVKSRNRQLELRLQSLEESRQALERDNETYRRQVQALEHLSPRSPPRRYPFSEPRKRQRPNEITEESHRALREQNSDLREEVEELRTMVELLRGQVEGRHGLVAEPRASPTSPLLT
ncbi:hypothetical protein PM082_012969 [Marasmius tenuissimus]|nr:hypothetical protein PM082_012969 [Marasmius tenuissimus]